MQFKSIATAAVAATLALSSLSSFAQAYDKRDKVIIVQQQDKKQQDKKQQVKKQQVKKQQVKKQQFYYNARGPEFVRGRALPSDLRTPQYVVVNYGQHRLAAPGRGQQWVQVGADYVLVAIATGVIANIVLNR